MRPMLKISQPSLGEQELERVKEVFDSRWLGHGDSVLEFEKQVQELLGARHVVAVNTGTSALHVALDALNIGVGDEVIVPSLTFCGCVQAITALNAIPVFCEVQPETLNIDVENAKRCITEKTRAIMPVHFCGNACELDSLLALGRENRLHIVEDAAHAFGSSYQGRMIGSLGDVTCFSFDPIKNITCGEGGAIVTSDDHIADLVRRKRMLGMDRDGWQRNSTEQKNIYEVDIQGYRYHMSNINAAIGLAQLPKLDQFRERKCHIVRKYNAIFERISGLRILKWDLEESFPFAYILLVQDGQRDALRAFLAKHGVGTNIHYTPNHMQSYFASYSRPLSVTELLYQQILTLPLYYEMTEENVDNVIRSVSSFFGGKYE